MNHNLIPLNDELSVNGGIPSDLLAVQVRLWELLAKQTARYTMGDSSSIPIELANELLSSICFTLGVDLSNPDTLKSLLNDDLEELFKIGLSSIKQKIDIGKQLWEEAWLSIPAIENISLRDTLNGIGTFFKRYDYRYFAHTIPCDIDYQLCNPVPETLLGVEYVNEYLRRLIIEHDFLQRFDPQLCIQILECYCQDYKGLLINLFEPIATNAIGLSLIGCSVFKLDVLEAERKQVVEILKPLSKGKCIELLCRAAERTCLNLGIRHEKAKQYMISLSSELYPRIQAAMSSGSMGKIFISVS